MFLKKEEGLFTKSENSDRFKSMITSAIVDSYFTDPHLQNEMFRIFGGGGR